MPEAGQMLSHYRLVDRIGAGGMGVVWKARDEKLRRHVALKLLPGDLVGDVERQRRFLREARTAAAVNHPNIATIYEVDEADGVLFLAMELVEGESLRARLAAGPMAVSDAVRYATAMADGLARAHEAGVVHRDLKPENVMIGPGDHPKILDFGLAKVLEEQERLRASQLSEAETVTEEMTRQGVIMGTVEYMSPEQARGEAVDARSDIFSLGTTLYEMVTGRLPFQGRTRWDTLAAVINRPAIPASEVNAAVPPELERVLARCLEKSPERRYGSSRDLLAALQVLEGTTEISPASALARRLRRHPARAALALIVMALAIGFGLDVAGLRTRLLGGGAPPSIAVLPCVNASGDPSEEYFADGITENLIGQVSRVAAFDRVINPLSAFRYKGTTKSPAAIASELGVSNLLLCTAQQEEDRVRVSVQLIDPSTEGVVWAHGYVQDLENVLTIGADVAVQIARSLEAELSPSERAALEEQAAVNPDAYRAYLKGRELQRLNSATDFERAIRYFELALQHQPDYAEAYAAIGRSYARLPRTLERLGKMPWREEWLPYREEMHRKAFDALNRAAELDPDLAAVHGVRGLLLRNRWEPAESEREFLRAIELDPNDEFAHNRYAGLLSSQNRHEEAIAQAERAVALDPGIPDSHLILAQALNRAREYDRAIAVFEDALRIDPLWSTTWWYLMVTLRNAGRIEEALEAAREFGKLTEFDPRVFMNLIRATAGEVPPEAMFPVLQQLEKIVGPFMISTFYAGMGEHERAIRLIEEAHAIHDPNVHWFIASERMLDPLRSDPRFQAVLEDLRLDDDLWGAG